VPGETAQDTSPDLYVGKPSLHLFDALLIGAADINRQAATRSFSSDLMPLQRAAAEIIPGTFHISLAIRQLIRSGHLFAAEVLLRPFLERCAVLAYLRRYPAQGLRLWSRGWPHKTRPSLKFMIGCIDEPPRSLDPQQYPADYSVCSLLRERVDHLNRLVHADPVGSQRNALFSAEHGRPVQFAGANFDNPEYCNEIAMLAAGLTSVLMIQTEALFGVGARH